MAYVNKENGHSLDEVEHSECLELAKELAHELDEKGYPHHLQDLMSGIIGELEEYAGEEIDEEGNKLVDEDDMSDEDLEKAAHDEMMGGKPMLKIVIKPKK